MSIKNLFRRCNLRMSDEEFDEITMYGTSQGTSEGKAKSSETVSPTRRRRERKPLSKKGKIVLGTTIPALVIIPAIIITILHFVGTAPNNRVDIPGSDPLDHRIEQELTEEEKEENEKLLEDYNQGDANIADNYHRDDSYFEENKTAEEPVGNPGENDERYDEDTDSNEVVYNGKAEEKDKNL